MELPTTRETVMADIVFRIVEEPTDLVPLGLDAIDKNFTKQSLAEEFKGTIDEIESEYPGIKVTEQHWVPLLFDLLCHIYIQYKLTDLTINQGLRIYMNFDDVLSRAHDDDILQAIAAGLLRETFVEKINHALKRRNTNNLALYLDPVNICEKLFLFFAIEKIMEEIQIPAVREFAQKVRSTMHCTKNEIREDLNHMFFWEQTWDDAEWDPIEMAPDRGEDHNIGRSVVHIYDDLHACIKCNKVARKKFRKCKHGRFVYYCSKECKDTGTRVVD